MVYQRIIRNPVYNTGWDQTSAIRVIVDTDNIYISILRDIDFEGYSLSESSVLVDNSELMEPKSLLKYRINPARPKFSNHFVFDGRTYAIFNDVVINKNHPSIQSLWIPGSIICALFNKSGQTILKARDEITVYNHGNALQIKRDYPQYQNLIRIYVTDQTKDMTHCHISITTNAPDRVFSNVNFDRIDSWDQENAKHRADFEYQYMLKCRQDTISSGSIAWMDFYIINPQTSQPANISYDSYIVEPVCGYAPHRRVKVTNGVGSFKVVALALENGDTVRMKVRTPSYSSLVECEVPVV